eukprot:TRINITY_DN6985_c0_g1_i1.p1 TRINITY_DN6985_c0_g1~~TRINITY_DN6985_c0_g1_i1.p1  ORF type:complete len:533 (-),score=80.00 TRINITY_DN6985_c0_g1_i1:16-1614(-)
MLALNVFESIWQALSMIIATIMGVVQKIRGRAPSEAIQRAISDMEAADSYERWLSAAQCLDILEGKESWKSELHSTDFDSKFIFDRFVRFKSLSATGSAHDIAFALRAGLRRNLGGITNVQLYNHTHCGTKHLIGDYVNEVVRQLEYLCNTDFGDFSTEEKFAFFHETRQSFGRSALMLSGGAGFGLYHIGVVKALFEQKLLPTVIAGASIGSVMAAIVAVRTDQELPSIFTPGTLNLEGFRSLDGQFRRKVNRLWNEGVLMDINRLGECVKANVGELTFEEAYRRTGRILNISVTSANPFEVPSLLNYLTTPHVLIWSAAIASCALKGLYAPVELLAKERSGKIVPYLPYGLKWTDGSVEMDLPMARLAELFNVNHFIVSQVNPHVVPFIDPDQSPNHGILPRLKFLIKSELKHRLIQMTETGLVPPFLRGIFGVLPAVVSQRYQGDVTIVPNVTLEDYRHVISNPTTERIQRAMIKGLHSTWPKIALIRNNTLIEQTLNRCVHILRAKLLLAGTSRRNDAMNDLVSYQSV